MNHFIKTLSMLMTLLMAVPAAAGDLSLDNSDMEMAQLLQVLDVETDLATKTKLNADFVPGMVTVLQGDELEAMGYQNVWEALALVPGLHLSIASAGTMEVTFRGIGGVFVASKYQFMVDGMPTYSTMSGTASGYHIDVSQVERIEVVRGPGSAIYGGFAYAGVINVIMRKNTNRVTFRYGSFNTPQTVVSAGEQPADGSLGWHVNVGHWNTDGANPLTGADILSGTALQAKSNAPGYSNEQIKTITLNGGVTYKNFSLQTLYMDVKKADHFGFNNMLPTAAQAGFIDYQDFTVQAKQHVDIGGMTGLDVKLAYRSYDISSHFLVAVPGYAAAGPVLFPKGLIIDLTYAENKYTAGLNLMNSSLNHHSLLLGLDFYQITTRDISQTANFKPSKLSLGNQAVQRYTGADNWMKEGKSRQNAALYMQDQIELGSQTTLTLGVRYDHYDDVGNSTNPRVALVHRLNENHMIKAQFATAFRPPTFIEMYSQNNSRLNANENIKPEQSRNIELGYVYRAYSQVGRITLYHTQLKDMIILDSTSTYSNVGGAVVQGVELEAEFAANANWKLKGNASYNHSRDDKTKAPIEGSANWLGNAVIDYKPISDYKLSLWGRYVGARHRDVTDARGPLGSDTTVDFSTHIENVAMQGLDFRAGIRNMFNHAVRHPSDKKTYPNDLPRAGRTWWAQTSYEF